MFRLWTEGSFQNRLDAHRRRIYGLVDRARGLKGEPDRKTRGSRRENCEI